MVVPFAPHTAWDLWMLVPKLDGDPQIGNFDRNQFGDPRTNMGIAFLVFFSVTHKIGLFSPKIEVIPNAMAHLSSPKI